MSNTPTSPETPPRSPRNNTGIVLIVAAVVVVVVLGFIAIGVFVGNPSSSSATPPSPTTPSVSVPPSTPPPTTPSVTVNSPTNLPPLHCLPAPPLPKNPQQWKQPPSPSLAQGATWQATLQTNCGKIVMDLYGKLAPQTVSSFIFLSQQKFYDDVPCHRLTTPDQGLSVLQCGDPTGTGSGGPGYGYGIENAPPNGQYPSGTVAMARTSDPNSNGSQFFIVYGDTTLPTQGGGYSIFGKVTQGLPIVQAIAAQGLASNGVAPKQPISMVSVSVKKI